jgi:hypothetical protein
MLIMPFPSLRQAGDLSTVVPQLINEIEKHKG